MFRRRQQAKPVPGSEGQPKPGGKGRPTPKRSEAEKQRRAKVSPPKDRRQWARLQREQTREARRRQREGMMRGEEKYLPARDRGPVRGFVRDYVDSRRTAAEFFLPGAVAVLALGLIRTRLTQELSTVLWLTLIAVIVVDSIRVVRGLKKQLRQRFPDAETRGVATYTLVRTLQFRRFRLPPPRVKPGDKI